MKKSIVLLNIVALITGLAIVFSCFSCFASDVPIDRFLVVGSLSTDGSSYSNQNITSSVVRNNYTFNFTPITGNSFRSGYLYIYTTSASNITDVFTLSGNISFSSDSPLAAIDNTTFSVIAYYNNGSQVINARSPVLDNHSDFNLSLSVPYVSSIRIDFTFSSPILSRYLSITISDFKFDDDDVSDLVFIEAIDGINNRLDQTNDLLEQGLNYTAPASDISGGVNDLGGSLIPDLESGVSDVSSAVSEHMPDINAWLSENPTLVSDMMSFSRLANAVMINFVHADGSIFIYISLACFISLLVVIEVNLKRGGGATVHNVYMSRTTPNDRKEDRYSRRGWGDSHRYFTRDRSYGGRYRR